MGFFVIWHIVCISFQYNETQWQFHVHLPAPGRDGNSPIHSADPQYKHHYVYRDYTSANKEAPYAGWTRLVTNINYLHICAKPACFYLHTYRVLKQSIFSLALKSNDFTVICQYVSIGLGISGCYTHTLQAIPTGVNKCSAQRLRSPSTLGPGVPHQPTGTSDGKLE